MVISVLVKTILSTPETIYNAPKQVKISTLHKIIIPKPFNVEFWRLEEEKPDKLLWIWFHLASNIIYSSNKLTVIKMLGANLEKYFWMCTLKYMRNPLKQLT
jgi:hypothetical protein